MPSTEKKGPGENLKDRFRSLFGPQDSQKKKNALPPKAHFSIWYFPIAFLLFSYLQQYFLSRKVETISKGVLRVGAPGTGKTPGEISPAPQVS